MDCKILVKRCQKARSSKVMRNSVRKHRQKHVLSQHQQPKTTRCQCILQRKPLLTTVAIVNLNILLFKDCTASKMYTHRSWQCMEYILEIILLHRLASQVIFLSYVRCSSLSPVSTAHVSSAIMRFAVDRCISHKFKTQLRENSLHSAQGLHCFYFVLLSTLANSTQVNIISTRLLQLGVFIMCLQSTVT